MCSGSLTNYGLCGHRNYTKRRCQNYLAKPRIPCEKLEFFETFYSLCPKCSGVKTPRFTKLKHKPPVETVKEVEELLTPREEGPETASQAGSRTGKRERAIGGIKKIVGSIRRFKMGSSDKETEVPEVKEPETSGNGETVGGWMTSERLADDYKTVIGRHPYSVASKSGVYGVHPRGVRDVERDTTWSGFVAQALNPTGRADEMRKAEELRMIEQLRRAEDLRKAEELTKAEESRKALEMWGRDIEGCHTWTGFDLQAVDPGRAEELRRADERLAQCRDGRRARTYEPETWI